MKEKTHKLNPTRIEKDEHLDIVDKNDQVIGSGLRSKIYKEQASNFRVVNGLIINSDGKLWIPTRSTHKRIFPNALDFSLGEHVGSGESYDEAFRRGAEEELNLDVDKINYTMLGKLTPEQDKVSSFMQVYEIVMDTKPDYNNKDFSKSKWFSLTEIRRAINKGALIKTDLPIVLAKFYSKQE